MRKKNLTASHIYAYYQPSKCGRRIYLQHSGEPEGEPSPYQRVILKLGEHHEKAYLDTLEGVEDLSDIPLAERVSRTKNLIKHRVPIIYHPVFMANSTFGSSERTVIGEPDFILLEGDSYIIRDCKIARGINDKDHPEILRQLELYGWLFQQTVGKAAARLEVISGTGEAVHIPYNGGAAALEVLRTIDGLENRSEEPYDAVGWSNCQPCGYFERCWKVAEVCRDIALVPEVDKSLVSVLRSLGIETIDDLAELDEAFLYNLRRPWGDREQKVGKRAAAIIRQAKALRERKELVIGELSLPASESFVIFDVEGLPPQLDETDKVYLWGLQVFGKSSSPFIYSLAGFGANGDQEGWFYFLENCSKIFTRYGDLPFIHWSTYEMVKVKTYIERYGDREGIGARVQKNLVDLLKTARDAIVLPDYSYSLKRVEKLAGYKRELPEGSGDWSMAKYVEATETEDTDKRKGVMDEILKYNQEDLMATWVVLQWLQSKIK